MNELFSQLDTYLQSSLPMAALIAYLAGLLASLTPCVYPMIPITASVIGGSSVGGSRLRSLALSLAYVLGLALMYAAMGIFAAATGQFFGALNTNPWVLFGLANFLLIFGLGMLDVFQLPTFAVSGNAKRKGLTGAFVVGMTSALAAGPCTAPVLGGLLTYVATSGDMFRGGLLLFVFALGMGTLLLAIGVFSGFLAAMPRSGVWMVRIKAILGVVLIGLAEYFLIRAGMAFI
ncbi:MAG: thiol:disulfide interchange protein [Deltaproteobacteria bacterium]|nr:MAG: thiol:disulfide interchange protein [Deltaproteobacteria bacterium]